MKKLAALSLALLFALGMTAAAAETYTAQGFYTIEYPEGLTLDNTSYTDESNDDNVWLYLLTNDDYMIDAYITKLDEYTGFSLYSATVSERENYVTDTLDDYADYAASLVETVTTAEGIPSYVYSMQESDGAYYYAETISNGMSVNFCCYYNDAALPLDDTLLGNLHDVLASLRKADSVQPTATQDANAGVASSADATSGATT